MNTRYILNWSTKLFLVIATFMHMPSDTSAQTSSKNKTSQPVIEIRSYTLKSGTREQFHKLMSEQAVPMLKRWSVDVVAYGPSLHDEDSYVLIRRYASVEDRQKSQDEFYGSDEWKKGPREGIVSLIVHYNSVVLTEDFLTSSLAGLSK